MASSTQWTWIWANSGRQRRKGTPDVLQSMGLQRVKQEQQQSHPLIYISSKTIFTLQGQNWAAVIEIIWPQNLKHLLPDALRDKISISFLDHKRRANKIFGASLIAQLVKNLPAMQETLVQFLGWEDLLENGSAAHLRILGLPWWLSW